MKSTGSFDSAVGWDGYAVEVFRLEEERTQVTLSYVMISRCGVRNKWVRRCVVFGLVKASPKFSINPISSKTYPVHKDEYD